VKIRVVLVVGCLVVFLVTVGCRGLDRAFAAYARQGQQSSEPAYIELPSTPGTPSIYGPNNYTFTEPTPEIPPSYADTYSDDTYSDDTYSDDTYSDDTYSDDSFDDELQLTDSSMTPEEKAEMEAERRRLAEWHAESDRRLAERAAAERAARIEEARRMEEWRNREPGVGGESSAAAER